MTASVDIFDTPYCRPAIPITLSLIVGIILGQRLPGFVFAALIIMLAAVARLALCLRCKRSTRWAPLLVCVAAGYVAMVPWSSPAYGPGHIIHYLDSGYWRIHATVVDRPVVRFGRTRLIVEVQQLVRENRSQPVRGRIRLTIVGQVKLLPGECVTFAAKIKPFRNFHNPGGFDYRRHMAFQGVYGSAWVRAAGLQTGKRRTRSASERLIWGARRRLSQMIDRVNSGAYVDEKAVLKALIFGDRSGIDSELRERFNRAGVGHLLAISGLHVGIVASVAFGWWQWLFSFFPPLLWRGWGRRWAAAAALAPVLAYGMLAGMSASTQRAEIMVAVFLFALVLGRSHDILNTLAIAALVILILFPPALFSISFQLSFAAVLAIVYGLGKIQPARDMADRPAHRAGKRLMGFVLVSALAIAGTFPVVLFHFNQTSLVGIAANLLLVPLVGFVVVPLGLLSAVVAPLCAPASVLGFRVSLELLHVALQGVDLFSGFPFAVVKSVTPSMVEMVLYYLAGWALLNLRRTSVASWVLTAVMVAAAGDGFYWSYQRFWHRDFKVTAIDVGQGASTLMELPGGTVLLMDGGGFPDNRLFDMGRQVVAPMLWQKKIATVEILVLSHPNADHLNGLIYIARHFHVRELWTNGDVNTTKGYGELMATCREHAIAVRRIDAGADKTVINAVTLAILNPPAGFFSHLNGIDQGSRNNGSLVLKATFGETAFLLTGDVMTQAEMTLVRRAGRKLASTVLFAPHHGSRSSSSPELLAAVRPDLVVISAGSDNRFGFPHAVVLNRYRAAGCQVLCTCSHGAIAMRSDGRRVQVRSRMDFPEQPLPPFLTPRVP